VRRDQGRLDMKLVSSEELWIGSTVGKDRDRKGHDAVAAAPSTGVNAVRRADCTTCSPAPFSGRLPYSHSPVVRRDAAAMEFFTKSTKGFAGRRGDAGVVPCRAVGVGQRFSCSHKAVIPCQADAGRYVRQARVPTLRSCTDAVLRDSKLSSPNPRPREQVRLRRRS